MIIRSRAPLRLGLAGGGTDVAPYPDTFGGYVLNATIDRYAYAVLKESNTSFVRFIASDLGIDEKIYFDEIKLANNKLKLHAAAYRYMVDKYNNGHLISMEILTFCDAPPGSGLGSSSTLVVAIIRAFVEYFNLPLGDYDIAELAYKIERVDCGLQGGQQDQYSATFGGFNFMEFYENKRTIVNPLRIKNWIICELEASIVMCSLGVSRDSAKIISDQSQNVSAGLSHALDAMHGIKKEALTTKECLLKGDFNGIVESIKRGWDHKKSSAKSVSNIMIDKAYQTAINAGALGGKVSGAGGGGFMWFYVPVENRIKVKSELEAMGGNVSNCHFTKNGCQSWRL